MKKIVGALLIVVGLVIGFFVIPALPQDSPAEILDKLKDGDKSAVTEKLTTIAEASVLEYDYTNAVSFDSKKSFKKIDFPFTSKHIVMTYDGKMKIGADVSELEATVEKDADGKVASVSIAVPDVKITSNEIDRDSIAFPVEKSSVVNKLKPSDYDALEKKAKAEIEKDVEKSTTMKDAENELKESLTGFLQGLYGDEVEVEFKEIKQ